MFWPFFGHGASSPDFWCYLKGLFVNGYASGKQLSAGMNRVRLLEWQWSNGKQMLDGVEQ
jgi:hypothetical protein